MLSRHNRFVSWLALLAMVLNSVWPVLVHAAPRAPGLTAEICSVEGEVRSVGFSGGNVPIDGRMARHQKHCLLCLGGGGERFTALPNPLAVNLRLAIFIAETPATDFDTATHFKPTSVAQPRAPPPQF